MILTDHYYSKEELIVFGQQIKDNESAVIDPALEERVSAEIPDDVLEMLAPLSDPAYRENCRRRERNIILAIMSAIVVGIIWMLYRFAVG